MLAEVEVAEDVDEDDDAEEVTEVVGGCWPGPPAEGPLFIANRGDDEDEAAFAAAAAAAAAACAWR